MTQATRIYRHSGKGTDVGGVSWFFIDGVGGCDFV
jgi:hypothetical protein